MSYINYLLSFIFILNIEFVAQTIVPSGNVSGLWSKIGSPYKIHGDISIPYLESLIIESGVLIEFQGHYKLNIYGKLLAMGTENDTITFTVNDTTGFKVPNTPNGGWAGIRFDNSFPFDSSKIIYCKLEYGKAIGSWPDNSGGAIFVNSYNNLTIANCLITKNIASGLEGPGGGGIAIWGSSPSILKNTISKNSAQFGGGISCYESNPLLVNNLIQNNFAEQGGGIVFNENSQPIISNTIIKDNLAQSGGGIVCWNNCNLNLNNVTFLGNTATVWAGGGISLGNSNFQINGCTFSNNNASVMGGAIFFSADTSDQGIPHQITIENSSFLSNYAEESGAINISNFAYTPLNINVIIENCEFVGNASNRYAALDIWDSRLTISNSMFTNNTATSFAGAAGFRLGSSGTVTNCIFAANLALNSHSGGVLVGRRANLDFMNCTFVENSATYGAGITIGGNGIATTTNCIFWKNSPDQIALDTLKNIGGTLTMNYCDIECGENDIYVIDSLLSVNNWGVGNIVEDPNFKDPISRVYDLQDSSPCIGAAVDSIKINDIIYYCPSTDIEGNPRPDPPGSMPDMGAYESSYSLVGITYYDLFQPKEYSLFQNYPNPFNPSTTIKYQIPKNEKRETSNVKLVVYDILGREIAKLVNQNQKSGFYMVEFEGSDLSNGIYFYKLQYGNYKKVKKMILMK